MALEPGVGACRSRWACMVCAEKYDRDGCGCGRARCVDGNSLAAAPTCQHLPRIGLFKISGESGVCRRHCRRSKRWPAGAAALRLKARELRWCATLGERFKPARARLLDAGCERSLQEDSGVRTGAGRGAQRTGPAKAAVRWCLRPETAWRAPLLCRPASTWVEGRRFAGAASPVQRSQQLVSGGRVLLGRGLPDPC